MIPYPIIDHISNKIFHIIRNFPKFYFANFWSMRCTTMCFQMTLWDQVLNAWISGWRLMTHYKIQHFEIPIEKKLNLKPPGKAKSMCCIFLIWPLKGFKTLSMFWWESNIAKTYMLMKQCQVKQSQNEILYKNRPYRLQSKCLLRALDVHENMLFACQVSLLQMSETWRLI